MSKEHQHSDRSGGREPLHPIVLPPDLAAFLREQHYAMMPQASDRGTLLVVKAPEQATCGLPERVPIHLRYEFYDHPAAPVIRMLLHIYDQPRAPLAFETFFNVADPEQRTDF